MKHGVLCWPTFHSNVYLLEARDGANDLFVKVGMAHNPEARIVGLLTGLPMAVSRVRFVRMRDTTHARRVEKELHKYLSRWRTHGEWFRFPADDTVANDHYTYGVSGQLDCLLCRGAWSYEEIDWPAFMASRKKNEETVRATGGRAKTLARTRSVRAALNI